MCLYGNMSLCDPVITENSHLSRHETKGLRDCVQLFLTRRAGQILKDRTPEVVQDLDALLLAFRELRCSTVSHMALEDAKASLLEIQRVLQDQFLALSIGILALVLAVIQTMAMLLSADLTIRAMSTIVVIVTGAALSGYFLIKFKTGRTMRLRQIDQTIRSAHDAKNEYTALKFTAEEHLVPALDACNRQHRITKDRYDVLKRRLQQTVTFFDEKIREKEEELRELECDKKKFEKKTR